MGYEYEERTISMNEELIALAATTLRVSEETAKKYNKPVPEINGWYFWNPVRGGFSVLINANGEKLAASSAVTYRKLLDAFISGKRN